MDEKIEKALEILLDQVRTNLKPAEALNQTQAILNMAHAKQLLSQEKTTTTTKMKMTGT